MRKLLCLLMSILMILTLAGCVVTKEESKANGEVTIVYTNDTHTYVDNTKKR